MYCICRFGTAYVRKQKVYMGARAQGVLSCVPLSIAHTWPRTVGSVCPLMPGTFLKACETGSTAAAATCTWPVGA